MAIQVKDASAAAAKFKRNAGNAGQDYATGVQSAGGKWAAEAGSEQAQSNWQAGVADAASRRAFQKGVAAAGQEKYVRNAAGVGSRRFTEGVANAEGDYSKGVGPYLDTMRNFTFRTPKGPKGSPNNWQRSQELGLALRAKKTGQTA